MAVSSPKRKRSESSIPILGNTHQNLTTDPSGRDTTGNPVVKSQKLHPTQIRKPGDEQRLEPFIISIRETKHFNGVSSQMEDLNLEKDPSMKLELNRTTQVGSEKPVEKLADDEELQLDMVDVQADKRKLKSPSPESNEHTIKGLDQQESDHLTEEETIQIDDGEDDDGYGVNGIGYKPTPQIAWARSQKRKRQLADWKNREEKEARARRSEMRRRDDDRREELEGIRESKTVKVHFENG